MATDSSNSHIVDQIIAEYVDRKQSGEAPAVEEYCAQHPGHAEEIRSLLLIVDQVDDIPANSEASKEFAPVDGEPCPEKIAGYQVIREIGRGGMGVVYEAEHAALGRRVALKVLPKRLSQDAQSVARFLREGREIAKMHHSNIVPLFEVGEADGRFFLVMQLIEGQSLDVVIRKLAEQSDQAADSSTRERGKSSGTLANASHTLADASGFRNSSSTNRQGKYRDIARLGAQAADALAYAHQRGTIHRDLKPSNLILDKSGVIWLTDFGLAKSDGDELTQTGDYVGTLRYMSPERFKGQCDAIADVYGLGLTLYELLTLQPAYDSSDRLNTIRKISEENPPRLRSVDSRIPRDLETIVIKAIEKEPADRYASAKAMADDLVSFANDMPIKARRPSLLEQFSRWSRRNKAVAAALAVAATSLIVLAIVATDNSIREQKLRFREQGLRLDAETAQRTAEAETTKARSAEYASQESLKLQQLAQQTASLQAGKYIRNLYFSEISRAGELLRNPGGVAQARRILAKWQHEHQVAHLRGWEWDFLSASTVGQSLQVEQAVEINTIEWSPDGTKIAFPIHDASDNTFPIKIRIEEAETGDVVNLLPGHANRIVEICWQDKQDVIASMCGSGMVRTWDATTGKLLREFGPYTGDLGALAWTRSGDKLAWSVDGDLVYLVDTTDAASEPEALPGSTGLARYLEFSPDGTHLATGVWFNNEAGVYSIDEKKYVQEFSPKSKPMGTIVVWGEGHEVTNVLHATPAGRIDVYKPDGELTRSLFGHTQWARAFDLSADGKTLITGGSDRNVFVWDLKLGRPINSLAQHSGMITKVKLSPVDHLAASISRDSVRLWDATSSHLRVDLRDGEVSESARQARVSSLEWNADSSLLAATGYDNVGRIWDLTKLSVTKRIETGGTSRDTASHPILPIVAFAGDRGGIKLLNSETGEVEHLNLDTEHFAWNADGTRFARLPSTGREKTVFVHKYPSLELIGEFESSPSPIRWHPTIPNRLAYVKSHGEVVVVDDDRVVVTLKNPSGVHALAWNHDGSQLATGCDDRALVWDVQTGRLISNAMQHSNPVYGIAWNRNSSRLATGSLDGTLKIWETNEWHQTITHRGSGSGITSVAWSPDSQKIAIGDEGGVISVWFPGSILRNTQELPRLIKHRELFKSQVLTTREQSVVSEVVALPRQPEANKPELFSSEIAKVITSDQWTWSEPVRLSKNVNSEANDFDPVVSEDGLELYFSSDRPGGYGGWDLYVCRRDSIHDQWGPAENLGNEINSPFGEEGPHVSADGKSIYFSADRRQEQRSIFVAQRQTINDEWQKPVLVQPLYNSDSTDIEPTLSSDGLTLVFASTRFPRHRHSIVGLWMSQRASVDAQWSRPENLGQWINMTEWQGSPSIFADEFGSTMMFHSKDGPRITSRKTSQDLFETAERFPDNGILGLVHAPFLWKDGRTLYYRRFEPETGKFDIWTSRRVKKSSTKNGSPTRKRGR